MFRKSQLLTVALLLLGLACSVRASQAQDDTWPYRDHPPERLVDQNILLPIDTRYFPEDEFPPELFDGMVIPDGPGPICPPQSEIEGGGWDQGEVDYESKAPGCRMPSLMKRFDASKTHNHSETAPRPPFGSDLENPSEDEDAVQPSSIASSYKIWAVNSPTCTDLPYPCTSHDQGMNKLYFSLSARKPTMNYGSPSDILYAVRMHAGGRIDKSQIQCPDGSFKDPNLVLATGWGATESVTISGDMKLVWERWDEEECATQMITNYTIPPTLAVYAKLYRVQNPPNSWDAQWRIQIWWNNAWTTVTTQWTSFDEIVWLEYGTEYDPLSNNNYGKAEIPYNFVGNVSYMTDRLPNSGFSQDNYPFDSSFVAFYPDWYNKYYYQVDSPFDSESNALQPNDQGSVFAHIN